MPGTNLLSILRLAVLLSLSAMASVAAVAASFAMTFETASDHETGVVVIAAPASNATTYLARPLGGTYQEQPPPTLIETIWATSSSIMVRPDAPTMREILVAADVLVQAGVIEPPEPSMREILLAADALNRAGALPPQQPPLGEVLQAVSMLNAAGQLAPAPPAAPVEPPAVRALAPPPAPPPPPAVLAAPPAPAPPPAPQPAPAVAGAGGWTDAAFEAAILDLLNRERTALGLQPVAGEPRLAQAAGAYAEVLTVNDWFSHVGPDGSTLVDRVTAAGFPFDAQLGEVLAWGADWSPEGIVQAWMASEAHRAQLLEPIYRQAGAGCYFRSEGGGVAVRCVVNFAA